MPNTYAILNLLFVFWRWVYPDPDSGIRSQLFDFRISYAFIKIHLLLADLFLINAGDKQNKIN